VGSLLQDDVQAAISTGFQTLFIAVSIALGAMAGELTLPAEQRVARMLARG
jgi:hypothetical protein